MRDVRRVLRDPRLVEIVERMTPTSPTTRHLEDRLERLAHEALTTLIVAMYTSPDERLCAKIAGDLVGRYLARRRYGETPVPPSPRLSPDVLAILADGVP